MKIKKKIVGILVCTLMIFATVLPVAMALNINKTNTAGSNTSLTSPQLKESRGVVTLNPIADSWIDDSSPNTNYGNEWDLIIADYGYIIRTFLKFDVSSIPAGATITDAKLGLFYRSADEPPSTSEEIGVYNVIISWKELEITWNIREGIFPWTHPGGDYDPTLVDSIIIGPYMPPSHYEYWNITPLVKGWFDGSILNFGVIVKCVSEGGGDETFKMFRSNNWGTPSERPVLEITYTKSKDRVINTPFLQFLESHSNLFPLLQKIIQRLGLQ